MLALFVISVKARGYDQFTYQRLSMELEKL
jgi:hypothetical protein